MYDEGRKEAAEIKKLPSELLDYLPPRKWRSPKVFVPVLVIILSMFLIPKVNTQIRYARLEAELNRYEIQWESKGISDYEYTIEEYSIKALMLGADPLYVWRLHTRVKDGIATPIEFLGSSDDYEFIVNNYDTVPDLYSRVRGIMRDMKKQGFNELEIRYNRDLGYLTDIINQRGYSYYIHDFKVLREGPPE